MNDTRWYQMSIEDIYKKLEANDYGLSQKEAQERLERFGPNELKSKRPSALKRFLRQFNNSLVYVLLIAAAITGVLTLRSEDMLADTALILGVVILNVILGFIQCHRKAYPQAF